MNYVIVEFNTDEHNKWVYEDRILQGDPLPMCIYGPFAESDAAEHFMECFMADDTDVHDVYVLPGESEESWTVINNPAEFPCCDEFSKDNPRGESKDCNEKKLVA